MSQNGDTQDRRTARAEAVDWLLRLEEGALDPEQQLIFEQWLAADSANMRAFTEAERLFVMSSKALANEPEEIRQALKPRGGQTSKIILLLVAVLGAAFWYVDGPLRLTADAMTGIYETRVIELDDGSRVTLNASSALSEDFDPLQRKVTLLRGEAYFEIAKDPARPFIVQAGEGQVRVVGTAFNVNMTSRSTEVSVTENIVEVSVNSHQPVSVVSGERTSYDSAGNIGHIEAVAPDQLAPWLSGRLVFEDQPLERVVEQLARRLPGRFVILGDALKNRRISGSFDLSNPDIALTSFADAFGLRTAELGPLATVLYQDARK